MKSYPTLILCLLAVAAAGFGVGRITATTSQTIVQAVAPSPPCSTTPHSATTVTPTETVATSGCEAADIRRIMREELAALREELANARAPADAMPPEPTPESVEALARGHRLVDAALSSRRWTEQDAQMMREIFAQLDQAQQKEVLQRLIPAMNRQEIHVSGLMGRPF